MDEVVVDISDGAKVVERSLKLLARFSQRCTVDREVPKIEAVWDTFPIYLKVKTISFMVTRIHLLSV